MSGGRLGLAALTALATLATFAVARPATAQAPTALAAPSGAARSALTVGVAVEPAVVLTLGYLHRLGRVPGDARTPAAAHVGARLKLPTTALRNDAWRLDLLGGATVGRGRAWSVPVTGAVYAAHDRNRAGTMLGLGTEVRAAPGRYGRRGALALDAGWQATWRTRIRHSAETRATFDDRHPPGSPALGLTGPADGWYGRTASRWRLGVAGSRVTGSGAVLQAALGALVAPQRQGVVLGFDLAQLPFYAEAGVRLGW